MGSLGFRGLDDGPRVIEHTPASLRLPQARSPVAPCRWRTAMRRVASVLVAFTVSVAPAPVAAAPEGQMTKT
jgi:hypothetical protein